MQPAYGNYLCPVCSPNKRFVTEVGLRSHVQEKHPWRALPPASQPIPPMLRAEDVLVQPPMSRRMRATNSDSHSMLSDEVFADNDSDRDRGGSIISMHSDSFAYKRYLHGSNRPKPAHSVPDLTAPIDSRLKKRRELVTNRRPWYDEPGYSGPRVLLENSDYFHFSEEQLNADRVPRPGIRRMEIELEDRDERIGALIDQMDKLMEERRLLQEDSLLQGRMTVEHSEEIRALKTRLRRKDKEINKKHKEMETLTHFLSEAAQQEMSSRTKLEEYMQDLHHRASTAEMEARRLREVLQDQNSHQGVQYRKQTSRPNNYAVNSNFNDNAPLGYHSNNRWKYHSDSGVDSGNSKDAASPLAKELQHRLMELKNRKPSSDSLSVGSDDNMSMGSVFSEPQQSYLRPEPLPAYWISGPPVTLSEIERRADALFCVFMYVDTSTLFKAGRVCREWYRVSRQPALWRSIRISSAKVDETLLNTMTKWCTEINTLCFEMLKEKPVIERPIRTRLKSGDLLLQEKSNLENGLQKLLKLNSKTLKTLRIIDCGKLLGEGAIWNASTLCPKLERLVYLSDYQPVGPELVWALGKGCPNLISLVVPPIWPNENPTKFNDECCYKISECFPRINVVCVGGKEVTERGLINLCEKCIRINHLEIDHGVDISEAIAIKMTKVGLRGLELLDFTFTPVSPKAIIQFNSACPKLKRITVHAGISDFFRDPQADEYRRRFQAIQEQFKLLVQQPAFKNVLEVKLDYG